MRSRVFPLAFALMVGCGGGVLITSLAPITTKVESTFVAPIVPVGTEPPPGCVVVLGGVDLVWMDEGGAVCLRRRMAESSPDWADEERMSDGPERR